MTLEDTIWVWQTQMGKASNLVSPIPLLSFWDCFVVACLAIWKNYSHCCCFSDASFMRYPQNATSESAAEAAEILPFGLQQTATFIIREFHSELHTAFKQINLIKFYRNKKSKWGFVCISVILQLRLANLVPMRQVLWIKFCWILRTAIIVLTLIHAWIKDPSIQACTYHPAAVFWLGRFTFD